MKDKVPEETVALCPCGELMPQDNFRFYQLTFRTLVLRRVNHSQNVGFKFFFRANNSQNELKRQNQIISEK